MSKVYVTGAGAISPIGIGAANVNFENENEKKKYIEDINPADYGIKGFKQASKVSKLACLVVGEALKSAKIPTERKGDYSNRTGLIISENLSNLESILQLDTDVKKYGVKNVNPGLFPNTVLNVVAGYISIFYNIKGANITISNTTASHLDSLYYALDLLNTNQLDRVVICSVSLFIPREFENLYSQNLKSESLISFVIEKEEDGNQVTLEIERNGDKLLVDNTIDLVELKDLAKIFIKKEEIR